MSNPENRVKAERTLAPNAGLKEVLDHIRAEASADSPPPVPRAEVVPPPVRPIAGGVDALIAHNIAKKKWKYDTISDEEKQDLIAAAKGDLRRVGMREETIEEVGQNLSHFKTRNDLGLAREAMKSGLQDRAERLQREQQENESARAMALRLAPGIVRPQLSQPDMIGLLNAWIGKEKIRKDAEGLNQRLLEHFPASFEKPREVSLHAHGTGLAIDEGRVREARRATRAGFGDKFLNLSRWMHIRYDSFKRAEAVHAIIDSRAFRYGAPFAALLFGALIVGTDHDAHNHVPAHADASAMPPEASSDASRFASQSMIDTSSFVPKVTVHNPSDALAGVIPEQMASDISSTETGDLAAHADESIGAPEPYVIKDDRSVWSGLLDGLGEKGIDLSEKGEQAFAEAVQRAIEETGTQSAFIEYKGEGLTDVAWDKIPDGATIHFDLLFGRQEFLDRLKELLESSEYKTLGKEIQSLGGADGFISDVQDAFGVQYL